MRLRRLLLIVLLATPAFASDPNQKRGFNAADVLQVGDIDHVNLFSGNVGLRVPLGQAYTVGPQIQYQFVLNYNSKIWDYETESYTIQGCEDPFNGLICGVRYGVPERTSTAGLGWVLSFGRLFPPRPADPSPRWKYVGSDGAEHTFDEVLLPAGEPPSSLNVTRARTTDSSYLELRRTATTAEIRFGDGVIHKFNTDGRLAEIKDRFGNWVKVDYTDTQWTVTDGHGANVARTHRVVLADKSQLYPDDQPNFQFIITSLDLAAFDDPGVAGDGRAIYQLVHEDRWLGRGGGGQHDRAGWPEHKPSYCITAPFLKRVVLPDGRTYDASYKYLSDAQSPEPTQCTPPSSPYEPPARDYGLIESMRLPTGGAVEWRHDLYPMNLQSCQFGHGFASDYVGVRTRIIRNGSGGELARWTYTPTLHELGGNWVMTCQGRSGGVPRAAEVFTNDVEVWSAAPEEGGTKLRTRHYFSVFPRGAPEQFSTKGEYHGEEYGRPFTRLDSVGSTTTGDLRFLSQEISDCTTTCTDVRKLYVLYEHDGGELGWNSRQKAGRTVEVADTGCVGACYTDTQRSKWDDFGHYEQTVVTSNVPNTPAKTTFTDYTPDAVEWLLNKYTTSWVKLGSGETARAAKSVAAFDAVTGAMQSLRTYRATGAEPDALVAGTGDLLSVWCRDSRGFVTSERSFGGDGIAIPASDHCGATRTTGTYFLRHEYTFEGSALTAHRAFYDGTSHSVADEDFDRNTGLATKIRDSAGVETVFTYDAMSRVTSVQPAGRVHTRYTYPTTAAPRKITVTQECRPEAGAACHAGLLTESRYYYDDLGRLLQEVRLFGTAEWASTWMTYDALGRKRTVSVPAERSDGTRVSQPSGVPVTRWKYDVLGRVTEETRPDSGTTTWTYKGSRETTRFVGTGKRSTEIFNGLGQLAEVRQRAVATQSDVVTSYGYDSGGRLSSVRMVAPGAAQERVFDYDGRGFLRWESHPESGMTSYEYDSRGHVIARNQSAAGTQFDLRYEYDAAERLKKVSSRNPLSTASFRVMKEFVYGTDNEAGDLRKGKLVSASRYNYALGQHEDDSTYRIDDAYVYGDTAGRRTSRTTTIWRIGDPAALRAITTGAAYNDLDQPTSLIYPTCNNCGAPGGTPDRSGMAYGYERGRLETISGFVKDMSYWPSGLRNELVHSNDRTDKQVVGDMPRPSSISFIPTPVNRCERPSFTSPPANTTVPAGGGSATLSVVAAGTAPFEYVWVRLSDNATVGTTQSITVNVTATDEFYVLVKNACGFEQSQNAVVKVGACQPPAIQSIERVLQPDGTWLLRPHLTSGASPAFSWKRLPDQASMGTTRTVVVPDPQATVTYRLRVTDACNFAEHDITMTPAPRMTRTDLVATVTGTNQITVTWPPASGASSYVVERRSGAAWDQLSFEHHGTSYVDNSVAANRTYAFRVYAVGSGGRSDYSNSDVATTRSFTAAVPDQVITATPANDMLAAVNAVRQAAGWSTVAWSNILTATDPVPEPSKIIIARHVTSARARMNEALSALGVPLQPYTDPPLAGVVIKAVHINEVQERAR